MSDIVEIRPICFGLGSARIKTKIATKAEEVDEGIQALMSNSSNLRLIGLDMIPIRVAPESSTSGKTSSAILQLCDSSMCLIVRLHSIHDAPESLYNFLILPCFTFAGFGIKDTIASLKKDYGVVCKNVLEVGPAKWNPSEYNFQSLRGLLKNMRMPCISNISKPWGSNFELTEDEIKLGVSNAYFAFHIANILLRVDKDIR